MADNTTLNVGASGDAMRTIDRSGAGPKTQVVSIDFGASGSGNETILRKGQATTAESVPVVIASNQSNLPVVGAAADGAAVSGNPVLNAGQDGTNVQSMLTDTTGRQVIVGAAAAAAAVTGNPVLMGGSDGTNARAVLTGTDGRLSANLAQVAGATVATGNGTAAGALRVALPTDGTGVVGLAAGVAVIGSLAANQSTNVAQINGVAVTMGNGTSGTGVQRVTIASDSTGTVTANLGTGGTGATSIGKARDSAIGATDTGVASLMVRRDAPTALTPVAADYDVPQINSQGAQYVHPTFSLAGGTVATLISAATTNATNVKASAGVLATIAAINTGATWAYLKFHNTAGTPTAGSGVVATYGLPPSGGLTLALPTGMSFATGIGITVTGNIAAADTTAVAASQVALTLTYH
jgi:hypothetical protein